jgi:hypothetical protein
MAAVVKQNVRPHPLDEPFGIGFINARRQQAIPRPLQQPFALSQTASNR